ncbi:hypothetical protein [Streptomyces sp. NPDC013457]|uniref:hypothetical protein n=1 Tax=Streptomyces sp. NPDC013457 TaxID=3364866 RepID=UPI0036F556A8
MRDLYERYMRAAAAVRSHDAGCMTCAAMGRCPEGARLFESFERLQDAYMNGKRP